MKTLLRVYSRTHVLEFEKCEFSPLELSQFRSNVQTACSEVVDALRAGFTFDKDMKALNALIESLESIFCKIEKHLDIPVTYRRTMTPLPAKKADLVVRDLPNDLSPPEEEEVKHKEETVAVYEEQKPTFGIMASVRLDTFLEKVCGDLNIELDPKQDIWERLDLMHNGIKTKLKVVSKLERDLEVCKKSIEAQNQTIASLTQKLKAAEKENKELRMDIEELTADLDDRASTAMKQKDEALKVARAREEQFFKLRMKFNENSFRQTLQTVVERLAAFLSLPLGDRDDLVKMGASLSETLVKKGCARCAKNSETVDAIVKVLKPLMPNVKDDPVVIAKALAKEYSAVVDERDNFCRALTKSDNDLHHLQSVGREIEKRTGEYLKSIDEEFEFSEGDLGQTILKNVGNLIHKHDSEMTGTVARLGEQHRSELLMILDRLGAICPTEGRIGDGDVTKAICDAIIEVKERVRRQDEELGTLRAVLEKVGVWLCSKVGEDDDKNGIEDMMEILDKRPNPLSETVVIQRNNYEELMGQLTSLLLQLKGGLRMEEGHEMEFMGQKEMIGYCQRLIEKVHDELENLRNTGVMQKRKIEMVEGWHLRVLRQLQIFSGISDFASELTVVDQISGILDDVAAQSIPIKVINERTSGIRRILEIEASDVTDYLPEIERSLNVLSNTLLVVKEFDGPLKVLLKWLEGEFSVDRAREAMEEVHRILKIGLSGEVQEKVASVVCGFVSLISALFEFGG
jgi:hypothetical protein